MMFVLYYRTTPHGFPVVTKIASDLWLPGMFRYADSLWIVPGTLED